MPFINTKVSVRMTHEQEIKVKERLGKAIACIPGKSESWLMCQFQDECRLYFKGDNTKPTAFVEVKIYGDASDSAYDALTGEITRILGEELGIPADRVYVQYEPCAHWGWNGSNF